MKVHSRWSKRAANILTRTRDFILAEPDKYDQGTFGHTLARREKKLAVLPTCDSPSCIAGTMAFYARLPQEASYSDLQLILAITGSEFTAMVGAEGWSWPLAFGDLWRAARTAKGKARAAAKYINHMLRTGEVIG